MTVQCVNCDRDLEKLTSLTFSFCSQKCFEKYWARERRLVRNKRIIRSPLLKNELVEISSGTCGAVGELVVGAVLLSQGLDVFRSLSPNSNPDLIVIKDNKCLMVEVRAGTVKEGAVKFITKESDRANFYAVYWGSAGKTQVRFYKNNSKLKTIYSTEEGMRIL